MVRTETLAKIASIGGLIVSATGYYMMAIIVDRTRSHEFYKAAMSELRQHSGAIKLLGEPIKDKRYKMSDSDSNFCDGITAQYKVPIRGSRQNGTYYFWSKRIDAEWHLTRAELELENKPDQRLSILRDVNAAVE